jgi:hypothetical protein
MCAAVYEWMLICQILCMYSARHAFIIFAVSEEKKIIQDGK